MTSTFPLLKKYLAHAYVPVIWALIPLHLWSRNPSLVDIEEFLLAIAVIYLAGALFIALIWIFLRDWNRAALLATPIVLVALYLTQIRGFMPALRLGSYYPRPIVGILLAQLLLLYLPLAAGIRYLRKSTSDFKPFRQFLNQFAVISAVLILIPLIRARGPWRSETPTSQSNESFRLPTATRGQVGEFPDIYFIVLDGYANGGILERLFGMKEAPLADHLEKKGFYVAKHSRCHKCETLASLTTTLNFASINEIRRNDNSPMSWIDLIRRNRLHEFLKGLGYETIHFSSGAYFKATTQNPYADINIGTTRFSELFLMLLNQSVFEPLTKYAMSHDLRANILSNFSSLAKIPENPRPTFTFAHFLIPHPPYLFDKNGDSVPGVQMLWQSGWEKNRLYADQLEYASRRMREVVDAILERSPRPPVILIQSDHGPASMWRGDYDSISSVDESRHRAAYEERTLILNAVYLPRKEAAGFYPTMGPPNTIRLVLNHLFGTGLPLIPDTTNYKNVTMEVGNAGQLRSLSSVK